MSPLGRAAFLLVGFGQMSSAIRLHEVNEPAPSSSEAMHAFREKILLRFAHVDADGDGNVSLQEMKTGFGHDPEHIGVGLLRQMLAECAGGDPLALVCTRQQMEASLDVWVHSHAERTAVGLLQSNGEHGYMDVGQLSHTDLPLPCGPSAALTPGEGLEGVVCRVHGAKCIQQGSLVAWSLNDICRGRTCVCEATPETKRLAKLGLMGAAAVTTAKNFTDPGDEMLMPACGGDWVGHKIVGRMEDLHKEFDGIGLFAAKAVLKYLSPDDAKNWDKEDFADTEVALFKSSRHEVTKGKPDGKVCMLSWQATRSLGDWKLNVMITEVNFTRAPKDLGMKAPKGLVYSYDSVRRQMMEKFESECCTPSFTADKIVISGHSHGGAMAAMHAIDMVTNWKCNGKDIGAKDLAVILVAPHSGMFSSPVISKVWSCNDPASCLAGSVATITTEGDFVGDGKFRLTSSKVPRHPSETFRIPCPKIPRGANYHKSLNYGDFWCHGMFNYVPEVEKRLVGEAGWGSTCGGVCGNPNRLVQCNQLVIIGATGCSYANRSWLKPETKCADSSWVQAEERCDCHYDLCTELTNHGCLA